MEISHLGWLPIRDASVMLFTPDVKMVIMKEYAQHPILRQIPYSGELDITFPLWIIQPNTKQNRGNVHIFGYLVGGMSQSLTC